jgi:hypothetical protein
MIRRATAALVTAAAVLAGGATAAYAGSPHFVDSAFTEAVSGDSLTVTGKEAGLGDEPQVHVVLTATAACVNRGGNDPGAANKQTVVAEGDFPVQNGRADFSLTATATFQPSCSPPMSVEFLEATIEDTTNGVGPVVVGTYDYGRPPASVG